MKQSLEFLRERITNKMPLEEMVAIVLLMLGQVIGLSVKYYFAFKKLDALFPNNEWERKDFKEKADYVDEKFEAMIVDGVLIFYGRHFTVIPLKELKEIHLYRTRTGRRVYYGLKFMFKKKRPSFTAAEINCVLIKSLTG